MRDAVVSWVLGIGLAFAAVSPGLAQISDNSATMHYFVRLVGVDPRVKARG